MPQTQREILIDAAADGTLAALLDFPQFLSEEQLDERSEQRAYALYSSDQDQITSFTVYKGSYSVVSGEPYPFGDFADVVKIADKPMILVKLYLENRCDMFYSEKITFTVQSLPTSTYGTGHYEVGLGSLRKSITRYICSITWVTSILGRCSC